MYKLAILIASFASVYLATTPAPAYSTNFCAHRRAGIYCISNGGYVTCPGGGALACPPHRDDKYTYTGRCVSNGPYDSHGRCRYTRTKVQKGPCDGKKAGKYCMGDGILTCPAGTGLDCGYSATQDYIIEGKCQSRGSWDNEAKCVQHKRRRT
jgi:hypothetical protein